MSAIAEEIEATESASALPFTPPPGEDDLPSEDGVPMETERHKLQMDLLIYPLRRYLAQQRPDGYVNGNMFVYYRFDEDSGESQAIGPDVMVALHVEPREHKSWLTWKEGKGPDVVIELLSDSTAKHDKSRKKQIYQDTLRVPEYFWFHPFRPEDFVGHRLDGGVYHPIRPDAHGNLHSAGLDLLLRRWQGVYAGVETLWLRWALPDGTLLPTPDETADAAIAIANAATARAAQESARAEKLAAQLRALGLEPVD